MNKRTIFSNKIFIFAAVVAMMFAACTDSLDNSNAQKTIYPIKTEKEYSEDELIKVIRQLYNPYSVENMRAACQSLVEDGTLSACVDITPTHYYVRFLPQDTIENDRLLNDTTLELFSYPLDVELTEGDVYIDSTNTSDFEWLYTRVPINYVPYVGNYEILDKLYLPEELEGGFIPIDKTTWMALMQRTLRLTGNDDDWDEEYYDGYYDDYSATPSAAPQRSGKMKSVQSSKWYPEATIQVYDDLTHTYVPVPKVEVRARHWFHWRRKLTDANGHCKMSDNFHKARFSMVWKSNGKWNIRDGAFWQAKHHGPKKKKSNWTWKIDDNRLAQVYGSIQRGCYAIFYERPLGAGFTDAQFSYAEQYGMIPTKITVHKSYNNGDYDAINLGSNWLGGIISQIHIYAKESNGDYMDSEYMFNTTVHEFTHSTHILDRGGYIRFLLVDKVIYESWASCVAWKVTNNEYLTKYSNDADIKNKQEWYIKKSEEFSKLFGFDVFVSSAAYTPIFIDLIDDHNQHYVSSDHTIERPDDKVIGFTLAELRSILPDVESVADLKNKVKSLRANDADMLTKIDKLFETYEKVY
jgi:hypothetical protein